MVNQILMKDARSVRLLAGVPGRVLAVSACAAPVIRLIPNR